MCLRTGSLSLGIVLLSAVLLTLSIGLEACSPEPGPQHFARPPEVSPPVLIGCFEVHNTLNGLPANEIRCVLVGEGWVMAGSENAGLLIFENSTWRSLAPSGDPRGFPSPTVTSLCRLPDGSALAGTPAGLVKLTREDNQWKLEHNPLSGATSRNLLSLMSTPEGVVVGTDNGAGAVVSQSFLPLKLEGGVMPTGFSSCGQRGLDTLFGCSHGLFLRRGDQLVPYTVGDADFGWVQALVVMGETLAVGGSKGLFRGRGGEALPFLPDLWITALAASPGLGDIPSETPDRTEEAGQLTGVLGLLASETSLAGRFGEDLRKLDAIVDWAKNPANWTSPDWEKKSGEFWDLYGSIESLSRTPVPAQALLKGLWVGTQQDGLLLFGTDGKRRQFTRENSKLPSNKITCISTGADGETWIGTADGGLLRYFRQPVDLKVDAVPVFAGKVETLELMGDRLYVGTSDQGLLVFDPGSLASVATYSDLAVKGFHRKVTGVGLDPQGTLWVGGDTGVWRLDNKGWKRLPLIDSRNPLRPGSQPVLSLPSSVLAVDASGRVFAVAEMAGGLSEQIFRRLDERFVSFSRETIKQALTLGAASAAIMLKELGLTETWGRQFDAAHASMSLAIYEKTGEPAQVSALLDTPNYLLIGTRESGLTIFDGQSFKPLSSKGSGSLGPIAALGKRGNGDLVIIGESLGQVFDGEQYRPIATIPGAQRMTDLAFDDLNADCFWVSWSGSAGKGGFSLYQAPRWVSLSFKEPVLKLAVLDPWVFIATPRGVFRLNKR